MVTQTQTRTDPSDAPAGALGKTDFRSLTWAVGATSTTLTVSVDQSEYVVGQTTLRAELGVHVLIDTTADGIADDEIVGTRDADGSSVDVAIRTLDRTQSTSDCQDLAGRSTAQATVASSVASGRETFSYTFDNSSVPGGMTHFRWAAFGQSPPNPGSAGPWDYLPDQANPDAAASNPGDRRCDASGSGVRVRQDAGIDFPDAATAVALSAFSTQRVSEGVVVRWRTSSAIGLAGFNLFRARHGTLFRVNRLLIGAEPAGSTRGHAYSWLDRSAPGPSGKLGYRLQAVSLEGKRSWIGSVTAVG
jgi:hypothetical protein